MLGVEVWAEVRRRHLAEGESIKRIAREMGLARNTVRAALRREGPPVYERGSRGSLLDAYRSRIEELLAEDALLPGEVILERLRGEGYAGGRTILNDLLRELRPRFAPPPRSFQRTVYEPGGVCQFDLWHVTRPVPVGYEQARQGYVVIAALGYSRAAAGVLVFSRSGVDVLYGIVGCLQRLGGVPRRLVWDREGCLHAGLGRPSEQYAALLGQLGAGAVFCRQRDPQAKGVIERVQRFVETSFEPGRVFVNEADFQAQLDAWFVKVNGRVHRTLRCRPVELVGEEALRAVPALGEPADRYVARVAADPYLRVDTNDYSVDPRLVGRRVEVVVTQREVRAVALETGEVAASHRRCFARHRTIADPRHLDALDELRAERHARQHDQQGRQQVTVQRRCLADYDALVPA